MGSTATVLPGRPAPVGSGAPARIADQRKVEMTLVAGLPVAESRGKPAKLAARASPRGRGARSIPLTLHRAA